MSPTFLISTMIFFVSAPLPFGGVGNSGMGSYHEKYSIDAFSHKKAVMLIKQNGEAVNS